MTTKFLLFRYLKNIDLHALTALDVLENHYNMLNIKSLKRYDFFEFDVSAKGLKDEKFFSELLLDSYEYVNPTKHGYFTTSLKHSRSSLDRFLLKVSPINRVISETFFDSKSFGQIKVSQSLLWEICINKLEKPYDQMQKDLFKNIGFSHSRDHGLLVNPLFEKASWCNVNEFYN